MRDKIIFITLMLGSNIECLIGSFGCSEKPANWYYYWEKDNVVVGLDAADSPASRYTSNDSKFGGASGPDNGYVVGDLCITSPVGSARTVTRKVPPYYQFSIGANTTFGIEQVAVTMVHEKEHIINYNFRRSPGQTDTDGDGLADSREGISPYFFIVGDRDTYDLGTRFNYSGYYDYGDNEFTGRLAEPSGLPAAILTDDWSKGGAQWGH